MNEDVPERLWDLLADKAAVGIEPAEEAELRALLARYPQVDPDALDTVAALLEEANPAPREEMPPRLRERIVREAITPTPSLLRPVSPARLSWFAVTGWLAAAASWMLLLGSWYFFRPAPASPDAVRAELLRHPATVSVVAASAKRDLPVRGEVAWNPERQVGVLQLEGLPINDPHDNQYQLWIFDDTRTEEHPVDGGVFDISAGGPVLVPFRPAVKVRKATQFVVTREAVGGVVVSERKAVYLVAIMRDRTR